LFFLVIQKRMKKLITSAQKNNCSTRVTIDEAVLFFIFLAETNIDSILLRHSVKQSKSISNMIRGRVIKNIRPRKIPNIKITTYAGICTSFTISTAVMSLRVFDLRERIIKTTLHIIGSTNHRIKNIISTIPVIPMIISESTGSTGSSPFGKKAFTANITITGKYGKKAVGINKRYLTVSSPFNCYANV